MEHNAEQIKKALACCCGGWCIRDGCPLYKAEDEDDISKCTSELSKNALSLINELTEENERLRAENESLAISEVKECEISQMLVYRIRDKHPAVMAVIADTVRKMQERLKEHLEKPEFPWDSFTVAEEVIDQIANEMMEEKQ